MTGGGVSVRKQEREREALTLDYLIVHVKGLDVLGVLYPHRPHHRHPTFVRLLENRVPFFFGAGGGENKSHHNENKEQYNIYSAGKTCFS